MYSKVSIVVVLLAAALTIGCQEFNEAFRTDDGSSAGTTTVAKAPATVASKFDRPGFVTAVRDGRLWAFHVGSEELEAFRKGGELAKHVTRIGAGPNGMTLKGPDSETLDAYVASKPGFCVKVEDARLWVFRCGSEELEAFRKGGELAKHVTRIGAGPNGMTLKGPDSETLDEYMLTRPGFCVKVEDGRLWVFRCGSEELEAFQKGGELAKHVTRIGAGPNGMTIKAPDGETMDEYLTTK